MTFEEIKKKISGYKDAGRSLFTTSSFQSHSIVMLHIISRIDPEIPVVFINTGYHFPETVRFKDEVSRLFSLNTIDLKPSTPKFMQRDADGRLLFTSDPDHCCYLNKTMPVDTLLRKYDVWINGIRGDQSSVRKRMKVEQEAPHGTIRFHPMLDWTPRMIYQYQKEFDLPRHPLEEQGYMSIGCEPCTRKVDPDMMEREARWYGMSKAECGLHTDLVKN
ncbi:phosphoadenylyl-sulfate reductase [Fulvivirga sedimenti]|uniref:Adenosine 5'-phosphosulfate reductase n=1 Tax=Fulvivirga sedimenti TaxID=2879465 RepID=A0A9X1HKI6_9BACT|nr:phosphoadenylyl-sulfate reductase [Fulvivirga sedimenti]